MSAAITDEPIKIITPLQISTGHIDAERYPIGDPWFYKPSIAQLDDGELLLTVAGPRIYAHDDRPKGFQRHHEDSSLYRSSDGGIT